MLHCVYHPVDDMRVVEDAERDKLLASGVWFDSPQKAKEKRLEAEDKIAKKRIRRKKGVNDEKANELSES